MVKGTVTWFNDFEGFGVIEQDGGSDVFVDHTSIIATGFKFLKEGERVNFNVVNGENGHKAENVIILFSTFYSHV